MKKYTESSVILKQLLKIAPEHSLAIGLYGICKRKQNNDIAITIKALAIASLLLVVSITIIQILLFEPFFDEYLAPFLLIRKLLTGFSIFCLFALEIYYVLAIHKETGRFPFKFLNRIFKK